MNQIINMVIKQVTRQFINRGIKAGFDKAGEVSQRRKAQQMPDDAVDGHGNPVQQQPQQMTKQERQARRQARQNAKAAKQGMTAVRRVSKF